MSIIPCAYRGVEELLAGKIDDPSPGHVCVRFRNSARPVLLPSLCAMVLFLSFAMRLSVSAGVACFSHDAADEEALLDEADAAMYAAKSAGRYCWRAAAA